MKKRTKIFDFYIESNLHVAFATACLVLITQEQTQKNSIEYSHFFIFFSTLLGYQFIRIFNDCNCNFSIISSNFKKQTTASLVIIIISFIGSLYFGVRIGVSQLWILVFPSIITIWYTIPLVRIRGNNTSLRNFSSLKIFSIALVMSINTVLFPLQDQMADLQLWLVFLQRLFLVIVLVIPFDIRDMHNDSPSLQTLPQKLGVLKTKRMGFLYLILFFVISFLKSPSSGNSILTDLFVFIISLLFLVKSSENQTKYYASFWVESVPIIWWIVLVVTNYYL